MVIYPSLTATDSMLAPTWGIRKGLTQFRTLLSTQGQPEFHDANRQLGLPAQHR